MTCPSCAHENRPGARFCEECAAPLAIVIAPDQAFAEYRAEPRFAALLSRIGLEE